MGFHPANLALRFVLELAALAGISGLGFAVGGGVMRWVLGIGMPVVAMAAWGTFNVPGDRSRSGRAPVPVPGWLRLLIEVSVFGLGAAGWFAFAPAWLAWTNFVLVVVHFAFSGDRLAWLLAPSTPIAPTQDNGHR